ncbi:hypothetical protein LCM20_12150 [Halobacillus litoralis]|uniref:hypothetical protein n=1 Tax=Halobacillus litoralis TaxID=45668 RepID=UPI001CD22B51|nr:hypothetical protein [Halobacillus litoralis]MCA0971349.1 hypothetical protein [Halobacillus litoralis]
MERESAFRFFGTAQKNINVIFARKTLTKSNIIFVAVDTALEVVKAGISYADYLFEKEHTEKLEQELERAKENLNKGYEERIMQQQVIIEEQRKRMKKKWKTFELEIEKVGNEMKAEVEKLSTRSDREYKEHLKRLTLIDALRAPILDMLHYTASLIDEEEEKGTSSKHLFRLQEDYRLAKGKYNQLIQETI